mgnify:FL=1
MEKKLEKLRRLILDMNREDAVVLSLSLLENESITIHDLYEKVLKSALYSIDCQELDKECIWKEHVTTAIVRTIIEVSYPYLLKEKKNVVSNGKKVIVVCPSEEYHEIGARMVHDYFSLNGFESTMIGANTPLSVILDAVEFVKPDFVAVSVTNFYNVINAKKIVQAIKEVKNDVVILAGGQAFNHKDAKDSVEFDYFLTDIGSIKELLK